jgi:hypothetical protein
MKNILTSGLIAVAMLIFPSAAEDSAKKACENAAELYADDDLTGALEEAKWCVTLLEQEQQKRVNKVFPDDVLGYQGEEVEHQSVMGFSATVRQYHKDAKQIKVTLSAGSGLNQAFSAIAQFGGNGTKTRIQKRTATVISGNRQIQIMVTLKKGGMLMFEADNVNQDQLLEFANAFPVAELDDSRQ